MKVEPRGKFGGVKIHFEPDDVHAFLAIEESLDAPENYMEGELPDTSVTLLRHMNKKIRTLLKEKPDLLQERSKEEVIAILAKEAEKAAIQLEMAKQNQDISKVDPGKLKEALLKHVKE